MKLKYLVIGDKESGKSRWIDSLSNRISDEEVISDDKSVRLVEVKRTVDDTIIFWDCSGDLDPEYKNICYSEKDAVFIFTDSIPSLMNYIKTVKKFSSEADYYFVTSDPSLSQLASNKGIPTIDPTIPFTELFFD